MALFRKKPVAAEQETAEKAVAVNATKEETTVEKKGLFKKQKVKEFPIDFKEHPSLLNWKPREKYVFHSDYFEIDNSVASILSFFHTEGAVDNFSPFWGINLIPKNLSEDILVVVFEQNEKMTNDWIQDHQTKSEGLAAMNENEQAAGGNNTSRSKASKQTQDLSIIAQEIQNGAAYLNVQYRLLVKAPTLEKLDKAIDEISRLYVDWFSTMNAAAYHGEQKAELSGLFKQNARKIGSGFFMTSTEYAGSYNLVTHGLEDPRGEYVGYMVGDVNNSAVLFDVNGYRHHIVVANENVHQKMNRAKISNMWGSKISQSCMISNGKVVHIIMDGCNMDDLGPRFSDITYKIDMNSGDVNMFEMFGNMSDELSVFSSQMQKLILMAEQAYETTESDRSIIRGALEEIATTFYIDRNMWHQNAKDNRDKLRVLGVPHRDIPRLQEFVTYLEMRHQDILSRSARDDEQLHAYSVLRTTFKNLLSNNGDLFNTFTSDKIDGATEGQRVLYDFSGLMKRGKGIAMAQLVNVIGFAVGNLSTGDTLIIHGTDTIDDGVKAYISTQLEKLYDRGGRVCFIYNSNEKCLMDNAFCRLDKADYTIFGNMIESNVKAYSELLMQEMPVGLTSVITTRSNSVCYIRRHFDNVVFEQDLILFGDIYKKKKRKRLIGG